LEIIDFIFIFKKLLFFDIFKLISYTMLKINKKNKKNIISMYVRNILKINRYNNIK